MKSITFEWDASKATSNKRKHGISFDEAKSAFFDEKARVILDSEHSDNEDRFVLLGSYPLGRQQKENQCNIMMVFYEKRI